MAQSCHVAFQFAAEHPDITNKWMNESNYICILESSNEYELCQLIEKTIKLNLKISVFREPDLGNQITSIAIEPSSISKKLCANFKLALR